MTRQLFSPLQGWEKRWGSANLPWSDFATALGYHGYPDFQKALGEMVRTKLNSIQRMEVTYGRISQGEILETVLQSDIEKSS